MKKISIKDIAKLSGYSVATVSRVINNNGRFSEETRQHILKIIEETGYQMNYSAKNLRMNRSFTIGIIIPDISNYFFNQLVQRIEELLFDRGYSTIICNTGRNEKKERSYLTMLQNKGVDGIIVVSGVREFQFEDSKIPYICIDREPADKSKTIFISSDHYQGAYEATQSLLKAGSQKPVIALQKRPSSSSTERLRGFEEALREHQLSFSSQTSILMLPNVPQQFEEAVMDFLNRQPQTDAIFAVNDFIACEILNILKLHSIKIPQDIKIIGFDDNSQNKYLEPQLSSVAQNIDKLSETTVDSLLQLLDDKRMLGKSISIPTRVIIRSSVANE